jgi:hypothetical protein
MTLFLGQGCEAGFYDAVLAFEPVPSSAVT